MSDTDPSTGSGDGAGQSEIRLDRHLATRWTLCLHGLTLTRNTRQLTKETDMTITAQPTRPTRTTGRKRRPMGSVRQTALVGGGLYLLTFISSIPAVFLLDPVLSDPNYIISAGADTRVIFGASLDLVNALACIGTAVALFSVVKRQHEGLALGFVTTRIMEAAVIVIGVVSLLAVVTLRQDVAGTPGTDEATLVTVGQALVAVRGWTFVLGPIVMASLNAMLLGTLMYRSRLVPRVIPTLGLFGGPLLLTSAVGILFGINDTTASWHLISTAPIFLWELSLGLYLVIKGFTPSPLTEGIGAVGTAPASRDLYA
jgi:Domain of unknown function (DUF4386)